MSVIGPNLFRVANFCISHFALFSVKQHFKFAGFVSPFKEIFFSLSLSHLLVFTVNIGLAD